jgi:mono/diheme cytochrome c family protein
MKFLAGALTGLAGLAAVAGFVIALGIVPVGATVPPSGVERKLAALAVDRSVARRAPRGPNPVAATSEALAAGLAHYRAMCVTCHGAPGVDPSEIGEGLNPPAPDLTLSRVQKRPDGQLFWLVQNGIRMTGMPAFGPTHGDEEIWKIVTFLRHLPELTPEEAKTLETERHGD